MIKKAEPIKAPKVKHHLFRVEELLISIEVVINQSGGEFSGSGSGEDYDGTPLTVTIQGAYYAYDNQISGTFTIRSDNRPDRVDGFTVTLINDTGYVLTSKDSSSKGCVGEARFLKIQ